jgi:hypothetical protein
MRNVKKGIATCGRSDAGQSVNPTSFDVKLIDPMRLPQVRGRQGIS